MGSASKSFQRPSTIVLVPDLDLRTNTEGLWNDFEALPISDRRSALDNYFTAIAGLIAAGAGLKLYVHSLGSLSGDELNEAIARLGNPGITRYDEVLAG